MYIEASEPRVEGEIARITSPSYAQFASTGGGAECLTFYYHMFGKSTGTLQVYIVPSSLTMSDVTPTVISGDQGNKWHVMEVCITSSNFFNA